MNLRDVKPHTLKRMATECDEAFEAYVKRNGHLDFQTKQPLPIKEVWREAYSKATHAILRRVNALKEDS